MPSQISVADRACGLRGNFVMRIIDKAGTVIGTYEDHNMIVNLARVALSRLVSEGIGDKVITRFAVGTNNATATPTDTDLTDKYVNDIIGHAFPDDGTVTFSWRLGYDEANDMNISEFGLYCSDGSLFSRKVRSPIFKASDIAFEGEWSIIF
jgi:hypothetical protein